jgi:hypothetical protein
MFIEDFILRQIALLVAVLAKVAGLQKAGQYQEAYQAIDQSLAETFGLDAAIVKRMDVRSLASLITSVNGMDTGKLYSLASLLEAEGEVHAAEGRREESRQSRQHALELFQELAAHPASDLEAKIASRIEAIQEKLAEEE